MENVKFIKSNLEDNKMSYLGAVYKNKLIGYVRFSFNKSNAWLYNISVMKEFRHKKDMKVGTRLLKLFEKECLKNFKRYVEGKYYPEGEEEWVVRKFYEKNGFEITREDYNLIVSKYIKEVKVVDSALNVPYDVFMQFLDEYILSTKDENELT